MTVNRRTFLSAAAPAFLAHAWQAPAFRAGAVKVNITPPLGLEIAGSMRATLGLDVEDELHARALVLDDGAGKLAFVVCDSCAIADEVVAEAKRNIARHTGIPEERVLISATHSHSAPAAARLFQSRPDGGYQQFLAVRISDAVRRAAARLEPARIGWGVGREESLLFNRRFHMTPGSIAADPFGRTTDQVKMNPGVNNPNVVKAAGPIDPEVCLLAVQTADGKPLAALASYALHYVGGVPGQTYSPDYFGAWAHEMERRLDGGPGFVAILSNACSGNINNVDVRAKPEKLAAFVKMRQVAAKLATECERVWRQIHFEPHAKLGGALEWLDLGVRRPTEDEVKRARDLAANAPDQTSDIAQVYAKETLQMAEYPATVKAAVQALRIGGLGIATFPGEAFVELGLEVKQKSPLKPTFLIELANGYHGYIPTVEGHAQGGYETWRAKSSHLEVQAAPKMVASALRSLERLARG